MYYTLGSYFEPAYSKKSFPSLKREELNEKEYQDRMSVLERESRQMDIKFNQLSTDIY